MYLLDTVVISELRKKNCNPNVADWTRRVSPSDLFLSTVTIGEINRGVELARRRKLPVVEALTRWLATTISDYGDRILPLDTRVAFRWGMLAAKVGNIGLDIAIAATALEHGLTVVTRNVSDFAPTGVATLNPFQPKRR